MVEVSALGGKKYCIDSTEVTNLQYLAWLASLPMLSTQSHPICKEKNTTFNPSQMPVINEKPVVYVDWCDAYAYCEMNGKRLCGSIAGGAADYLSMTNAADNQWYFACSKGGTLGYPYGGTYVAGSCNGDAAGGSVAEVKTYPNCQGGYDGLFDMSGNVWEWEDACDAETGETDKCRRRGGSVFNMPSSLDCQSSTDQARGTGTSNVGFRCCADQP